MSTYSTAILATPGLVSYWRLGEASGTSAADSKGSNTGTSTDVTPGATGLLTGDSDTAYTFGTNANRVDCGNDASLQLTAGSVECLFKTSGPGAGFHGLAIKANAYGIFFVDNVIGWYDWTGGAFRSSGVSPIDNAQHHAVLVFDSGVTNGSFLYLDGALILTSTMTVQNQSNGFAIGAGGTDGAQSYTGVADEVAVYNTKLSAATITNHYAIATTGVDPAARRLIAGLVVIGGRRTDGVLRIGRG